MEIEQKNKKNKKSKTKKKNLKTLFLSPRLIKLTTLRAAQAEVEVFIEILLRPLVRIIIKKYILQKFAQTLKRQKTGINYSNYRIDN